MRTREVDTYIAHAERALDTIAAAGGEPVRKRRTLGFRTIHNTWVRMEARALGEITTRGWNGIETSATLTGVSKPEWYRAAAWRDNGTMWRADEMSMVNAAPVQSGGTLSTVPELPHEWWETLRTSLEAIAAHTATHPATRHTEALTQARITATIRDVFGDVSTDVYDWIPAHGDLSWPNITAPHCVILDWEDWGRAPRGFDAATLWASSLAVPTLADQVYRSCRGYLETPAGIISRLFVCAEIIQSGRYAGATLDPAREHANALLPYWAGVATKSA